MKPREIYNALCEAPDLDAAAKGLSLAELVAVAEYLAGLKQRGIAAQVWGVVKQELEERTINQA